MVTVRIVAWLFAVGPLAFGAGIASCQNYPNKVIRILTSGAGSGGDFVSRVLAQGISGPLGQQVIVENRASGLLAAEAGAKSMPDGYTLFVGGGGTWINPLLQTAPYDVVRDYAPISMIVREINVFVVHPSLPAKSIKELIALAKAKPGALNYAATPGGNTQHLGTELFKSMAGIDMVHIPYKNSGLTIPALLSGEAQVMMSDLNLAMPHVQTGKIRALAVTSATPSVLAPGLPTVASDLPGFEVVGTTGIWAPAKTPDAIVSRLNQEILRVLAQPDVKERFLKAAAEVVASSPEQFASFIKSDIANMSKVIMGLGIKP